jgi:hypothetical protein
MSVELPSSWTGRIVLGATGRPVLHAASFPLSANDDDSGEIARESIGTAHAIYLNVRNLGVGGSPLTLPVTFSPADFGPPSAGGCCRINQAIREGSVNGQLFRVAAVSGGDDLPPQALVAEANGVLGTLTLAPYVPQPVADLPLNAQRIEGYGMSMRLPAGWDGRVRRGELDASSREISLKLLEHATGIDGAFVTGRVPIRLSDAEFVPPGETGRSFIDRGRAFVLWVKADRLPPSAGAVEQANEALATLHVEPGDFYPGTVAPATFAAADDWHTGTSGITDAQPDGQQTWTWASTIPYADEPFQFLPHKTLAALPPDGIVIDVQLFESRDRAHETVEPPFRIMQADGPGSMEGLTPPISLYGTGGRVPGQSYDVDISVMFGREHPTPDQFARANVALARLQLPDWTSVSG